MSSRLFLLIGTGLWLIAPAVTAWVSSTRLDTTSSRFALVVSKTSGSVTVSVVEPTRRQSVVVLSAFGGFGGGGSSDKNDKSKKKETKLKPKQQWDRYLDLKKENRIRVALRVSEDGEWLEVGNVKSKDNRYTEIALARQRALVAEHGRRLFPLQVSTKDTVTWAFWNEESETWTIVDKSILDDAKSVPANVEKLIGFEGRPDPSSGFYCLYDGGRVINTDTN